jgi:hypothetical protein
MTRFLIRRRHWATLLLGLPLLFTPLTVACRQLNPPASEPPEAIKPTLADVGIELPTQSDLPVAPNGNHYPLVPAEADNTASLLVSIETALVDPDHDPAEIPQLAHQQQVIYRVLSHNPALSEAVRNRLPSRWQWVFDQHISARRSFLAMHRGPASTTLPAWRIQAPAPQEDLLKAYRSAADATGIPWEVLAAVNLVETGMGRIDGVSVANAQGPMQFLPTTWAEPGIGRDGDIRDPWDAIHAAARYLVRRGGLNDIRRGLWGYNNSDHYGKAVLHYAALLQREPLTYRGLYNWQIHYSASAGDLWLHEGYAAASPVPVAEHLKRYPHSAPPQRGELNR